MTTTKRTSATIAAPTTTQEPAPAPSAVDAARRELAQAEQGVRAAAHLVAARQEAAIPAALRQRDMAEILRLGILPETDARVRDAARAWQTAKQALDQAHQAHHRAEQGRERAADALAREEQAADRARRRQWAEAQHPDVVRKFVQARQEEQRVLSSEYALSSSQGQSDLRLARARAGALEAALERIANEAPAS